MYRTCRIWGLLKKLLAQVGAVIVLNLLALRRLRISSGMSDAFKASRQNGRKNCACVRLPVPAVLDSLLVRWYHNAWRTRRTYKAIMDIHGLNERSITGESCAFLIWQG